MTLLQTSRPGVLPPTSPHDSVLVVQTPQGFRLPAGPSTLTRALFDRPQEIQWLAISVGALLFAALAFVALRYRMEIVRWVQTRSRAVTVALGTAAGLFVVVFGLVGWSGWQMMEHDNAFCTSCHLMHPMIAKFYQTKHKRLECHDCHKQSILADTKELSTWVLERPGAIPSHENAVPNRICEGCHLNGDSTKARQIGRSTGHLVHLRSTKLPGIACTQCHARPTPHEFRPTNATCTQGGCHDDVKIKLAKMQPVSLHCTGCHDFKRLTGTIAAPFDTLERTILPIREQCVACHSMKDRLKGQSFSADPHRQQCGVCHNPHRQSDARAAEATCSTGGCHAQADTLTRFHAGLPPRALSQCTNCHTPHTWKAKSKVCADCHAGVENPAAGSRPVLRPDAALSVDVGGAAVGSKALRRSGRAGAAP